MKLWTTTYNDDSGNPTCEIHTSAQGAYDAQRHWLLEYRRDYPDVDFTQDNTEIFDALCERLGFMDSCTIEEHSVVNSEHSIIEELIADQVAESEGDLELDDNAPVSWNPDAAGAYVQTWQWVYFSEIEQPMVIEEGDTLWYFDNFEEFMLAWGGVPDQTVCRKGRPEDIKISGVNDAWEFLTAKNDALKLKALSIEELQGIRRNG